MCDASVKWFTLAVVQVRAREREDFSDMYARAREERADRLFEELFEIADKPCTNQVEVQQGSQSMRLRSSGNSAYGALRLWSWRSRPWSEFALQRQPSGRQAALAPDVLVAATGNATVAPLLQATRTVPIVFVALIDPVGAGFVASLAQPGGNATGFTIYEYSMSGK